MRFMIDAVVIDCYIADTFTNRPFDEANAATPCASLKKKNRNKNKNSDTTNTIANLPPPPPTLLCGVPRLLRRAHLALYLPN